MAITVDAIVNVLGDPRTEEYVKGRSSADWKNPASSPATAVLDGANPNLRERSSLYRPRYIRIVPQRRGARRRRKAAVPGVAEDRLTPGATAATDKVVADFGETPTTRPARTGQLAERFLDGRPTTLGTRQSLGVSLRLSYVPAALAGGASGRRCIGAWAADEIRCTGALAAASLVSAS